MKTSQEISRILKDSGVNLFTTLPCEKVKHLYSLICQDFRHVGLSREEEGVGISAGAYLARAKPAMLVQSSGFGNMANALCSLTKTYRLSLLILVSWRGVYKEKVPAQIPLGKRLPRILEALDISYSALESHDDLPQIGEAAREAYSHNTIQVVLISPNLMENEKGSLPRIEAAGGGKIPPIPGRAKMRPSLTRFEILKTIAPFLEGKIVVCNLGVPCRELFKVNNQKSNFYMLGSMGLASSIGLGISLFTRRQVVVIDGNGSLLMNLGSLATIAREKPPNLTILAIDNGVHGSTGNQPTATTHQADLELIARGAGFKKTFKEAEPQQLLSTLQGLGGGPSFVHILTKPGDADLPYLPLSPIEIRDNVIEAITG